jgi:ABC-type dipeptide/oligopeptide/nickel transport system permease component
VTDLILDRFGSTIRLAVAGLALSLAIGLPLGMLAAIRQNSWIDTFAMGFAYVGASMPVYWVGLVLILVFSFRLGWFPPAGADSWQSLVLPALTLGLVSAGVISRLVRSSMVEVLTEDYIRAARAKGLSQRLVLWRHGLKNALIPVVTMLGLQFGAMLAGAVVTETVFSRPGIGRLVVAAILQKDYPLVQGCIVFLATVYLLVNLLVDLAYAWLDPRIRYGR